MQAADAEEGQTRGSHAPTTAHAAARQRAAWAAIWDGRLTGWGAGWHAGAGICKIVPPKGWAPAFELDRLAGAKGSQGFKFAAETQSIGHLSVRVVQPALASEAGSQPPASQARCVGGRVPWGCMQCDGGLRRCSSCRAAAVALCWAQGLAPGDGRQAASPVAHLSAPGSSAPAPVAHLLPPPPPPCISRHEPHGPVHMNGSAQPAPGVAAASTSGAGGTSPAPPAERARAGQQAVKAEPQTAVKEEAQGVGGDGAWSPNGMGAVKERGGGSQGGGTGSVRALIMCCTVLHVFGGSTGGRGHAGHAIATTAARAARRAGVPTGCWCCRACRQHREAWQPRGCGGRPRRRPAAHAAVVRGLR